jgi:hypothetical protein
MRTIPFVLLAIAIAAPQTLAAAEAEISCTLSKETILFTPQFAQAQGSTEKHIEGVANFTVAGTELLTPMGAPCERVGGKITDSAIAVSCSFVADKNTQTALQIAIDRRQGTIGETWDITESDGSAYRYLIDGTCRSSLAPDRLVAGLAHGLRQE